MLEAYLDYHREALRRKVLGVSNEDARRRLVPSLTTLGGLLKHMTAVERHWFHELMGPEEPPGPRGDDTFVLVPEDTVESLIADYDRECARSRELSSEYTLADSLHHESLGDISLRWIFVHMIEETARHAGHADILRELTDGKTGGLL
jgi:uncharacterized damage-inducible protein DinB